SGSGDQPDTAEAVPGIPAHAAANLRRSVLWSIPVGVAALAILIATGHPIAGVLLFVGLALGATNTHLVQRSVAQFAPGPPAERKRRFITDVLCRLAGITLVAVAFLILIRPDGLGVVGGLAVFQLLMIGSASLPVFKELRKA